MSVTLYGIPTCGTAKKARRWLDQQQIAYQWVDLRQDPPEPERVERWVAVLTAKPMRNTSSGAYRALGPEKKTWNDEQWLAAFKGEVMLLKRPIVEIDGQPVTVGFKEPVYESLFS